MSLSLWSDWFCPSSDYSTEIPTLAQIAEADNWLFKKDENGYKRAELAIKIIWQRSYDIHKRQGGTNTGLIALWSVYKQFAEQPKCVPTRKTSLESNGERQTGFVRSLKAA